MGIRATVPQMATAPERIFLWLGLLTGIFYLAVTPPFQVPDEQVHFFRAYQLSQGDIIAEKIDGQLGGHLPKSVIETVDRLLTPVRFHPDEKVSLETVAKLLRLPLNRADTQFIAFESSAIYSPIPYLPQLLGISWGKLFDASPLALLYIARLWNLVVAILLVAVAIRTVPILKWSFVLIAVSPMAMFQMASVSADGFTIGISFLVSALLARFALNRAMVGNRGLIVLTVAALLLTVSKQYLLIPFLYFLIPRRNVGSTRRYVVVFLALIGASGLALGAWLGLVRSIYVPVSWVPGVDPAGQARLILGSPLAFVRLVLANYMNLMPIYLDQMTGRYLGWLDTPMPVALIRSHQVVLVLVAILDGRPGIRIDGRQRGVLFAVLCANMLLISTFLYLSGNPLGAQELFGIQGRYFIPLLPLALMLLYNRRLARWNESWASGPSGSRYFRVAICAYSILVSLVTLRTLAERYYGGGPGGAL